MSSSFASRAAQRREAVQASVWSAWHVRGRRDAARRLTRLGVGILSLGPLSTSHALRQPLDAPDAAICSPHGPRTTVSQRRPFPRRHPILIVVFQCCSSEWWACHVRLGRYRDSACSPYSRSKAEMSLVHLAERGEAESSSLWRLASGRKKGLADPAPEKSPGNHDAVFTSFGRNPIESCVRVSCRTSCGEKQLQSRTIRLDDRET
jgi:hypothetical protein